MRFCLNRLAFEYRVRKLENLLLEGKKDQEILNDFLGNDYYNKYQSVKNKIKDPEYKDIYKMIKKDPDEVKSYIDTVSSNRDLRKSGKSSGAKLIYKDSMWKVYRITTYSAAQLYGKGTMWCIAGTFNGHEERGLEYFNDYIIDYDLDGGYYFYIKNDGKTKFCLLRKRNGVAHSIWDAEDLEIDPDYILLEDSDFPRIKGVFIPPSDMNPSMFSSNCEIVRQAIDLYEDDINKRCDDKSKEYYGYLPIDWQFKNDNVIAYEDLLKAGAKISNTFPWQLLLERADRFALKTFIKHGLLRITTLSEMLYYIVYNMPDNDQACEVIVTLINLGANVNKKLRGDKTILYYATSKPLFFETLLSCGADIDDVDKLLENTLPAYKDTIRDIIKEYTDEG